MEQRSLYLDFIRNVAFKNDKMAFVSGPRQVGKTTLAQQLLTEMGSEYYYTWDDIPFRRQWIKDPKQLIPDAVSGKKLVVFDELHKAPRWKSSLKGVFDLRHEVADILVTGSARLDIFRRGGDSLLGRYFLLRMHPFTLGELHQQSALPDSLEEALNQPLPASEKSFVQLFRFGGFPEPYLKASPQIWNIWRRSRVERLVREDLRDLARTTELSLIEACAALIPERVGSPFSMQSLAEDLSVSHPTVRRWVKWLSQLFYLYIIPPFSKNISRSLKKQPKIYLWDWSEVEDESARFENMVASHLLKATHFWTDTGRGYFELFYLRDKEKREVDFLITREKQPWLLAECKFNETNIAANLLYSAARLRPPLVIQVIRKPNIQERFTLPSGGKGWLVSASSLLTLF